MQRWILQVLSALKLITMLAALLNMLSLVMVFVIIIVTRPGPTPGAPWWAYSFAFKATLMFILSLMAWITGIVNYRIFTERASSRQNPSHAEERSSHP